VAVLIFILRLGIGALLIVAGVFKLHDGPTASVEAVAAYKLLPQILTTVLGVALPYLELALGGYLVLGLFTRIVGWIVTAQFLVFSLAVASLVIRKLPADCGCFGSGLPTPPSWGHVAVDVLLAALAFTIARYGPGAFAVDRWLSGGAAAVGAEE
jgi:uncharacterized membrane protein YphA (DoxX/SURF4 family)